MITNFKFDVFALGISTSECVRVVELDIYHLETALVNG